MPRKLFHLTLAAARKRDLIADWARLGFTVDAERGSFTLADGVTIDFFAPDSAAPAGVQDLQARAFLGHFAARRSGVALFSLGDDDAVAQAQPLFGADCYVHVAPPTQGLAPPHANGARDLVALAAVAENPADHAELLAPLTGQREMLATSAGLEIRLEGGCRLDILTPPAFAFRFGVAAPVIGGFRLGGLIFGVDELETTQAALHQRGVKAVLQAGRLLAGAFDGVAVAFEQD